MDITKTEDMLKLQEDNKFLEFALTKMLKKDWSTDWLKMNEKNLLAQSSNNLTNPAQNSYAINKCITIISQNFPTAPLIIYNNKTGDPVPEEHPIYSIFKNPNDYMTEFDLWAKTSMFFTLYGESFWYLNRNTSHTKVLDVQVIDPRGMKEVLDEKTRMLVGWLFNNRVSLTLDEVIHFKNENAYNPWRGLSPLDAIKIESNTDYKSSKYQEAFYNNGAIPSVVITTDQEDDTPITELRKIKKLWDKQHMGSDNAHKTAVIRGGMKLDVIGLNNNEMEFIESRKFTREIILMVFGVPGSVAGLESVNRSIGETNRRTFWQNTMKPQLLRVQYSMNKNYFARYEPGYKCKFDFRKVDELQKDYADDIKASKDLFQMGFSRNELNYRFDLGFDVNAEYGDDTHVPLNLIPQDKYEEYLASKANLGIPIQDNNSGGAKQLLVDLLSNKTLTKDDVTLTKESDVKSRVLFDKLQTKWHKTLKSKYGKFFLDQRKKVLTLLFDEKKDLDVPLDEGVILARINILDDENKRLTTIFAPIYAEMIKEGQELALMSIGVDRDIIMNKDLLFDRMNIITNMNDTVYRRLRKNISEGILNGETIQELADRVRKDVYNKVDAVKIARTESSQMINAATWNEYKEADVKKKSWSTAQDGDVREEHSINAKQGPIDVNEAFQNGEMYPGQNSVNCRCCLIPIIDN